MDAKNETTILLEALQSLAGCSFLSDLHAVNYHAALLSALEATDATAYSAHAWNYAASYIASTACDFSDAAQAREWLIAHLSSL